MTKQSPTTWSPIKPGQKPLYIPANTRFFFLFLPSLQTHVTLGLYMQFLQCIDD